jgi:Uncharacterised nucleotidyltransferase
MNNTSYALPRFAEIEAALCKITETLAGELVAPTNESPLWTEFEWRIARAVAGIHGISTLLHARLLWEGPKGWQTFLREQQEQSVARHEKIIRLLQTIDSQARRENTSIVALKGAALLKKGLYAPGERPMGDIDLLVRADEVVSAARLLEACGYEPAFTSRRHQVFRPLDEKIPIGDMLGEHVDSPIKIELHTRIAESLPVTQVDITQFVLSRTMQAGLNPYPSLGSLMIHLLLHAAGNMRARALRLIQLHDISLLAARFGSTDWAEFLAAFSNDRSLWWAYAPVMLTAQYYPGVIPAGVIERLSLDCPLLLRRFVRHQRLTGVSWSNIRIEAFPGLEWSRTAPEAFEFMRNRIWPSREARLELKDGAAQIPNSSSIPWYGLAHRTRILRWVISRPPRVQTLLSVRAALAQEV